MERAANSLVVKPKKPKLRFERKFVFPAAEAQDLIHGEILTNSYCFREIFHRRSVNNIYFDRPEMTFYYQNVDGDSNRRKFRLRWYGDDLCAITKPVLEVKKKFGEVGDKESVKLKGLSMDLNIINTLQAQSRIEENLEEKGRLDLLLEMQRLVPKLINSYERRYFRSICDRFRITIDYNMRFYNPELQDFLQAEKSISNVVLELKYPREHDDESRGLAQEITARLSKNSKYVQGIDMF